MAEIDPDEMAIAPRVTFSEDTTVLTWDEIVYHQECGHPVSHLPDGSLSVCAKRKNHPGDIHEDFDGRTHDEWELNLGVMSLKEAVYVALRSAGDCWEGFPPPPNSPKFMVTKMIAIENQLMARIKQAGPSLD